jgi:hypothetical protein
MTNHKVQSDRQRYSREVLANFSALTQLRVLGLIDITTTFAHNIPDETENRRVRTSSSVVNNKIGYGMADSLGNDETLKMLDLVQPEFRGKRNEAVFALFGRSQQFGSHNLLTKYLHDNFLTVFSDQLRALDLSKNEGVPDALRRSFLTLNRILYDDLTVGTNRKLSQTSGSMVGKASGMENSCLRSGASGIVLYLADNTLSFLDKPLHIPFQPSMTRSIAERPPEFALRKVGCPQKALSMTKSTFRGRSDSTICCQLSTLDRTFAPGSCQSPTNS